MMDYQIHNKGNCKHGRHQSGSGNDCGCHGTDSGFHRRFVTKAEIKEQLETYKDELKKELEGVEDQLKKLSSRSSF